MRYNETDVAYFGCSPTGIGHRGWLWKRGEAPVSSVPSFAAPALSTLYKKRWFVLKGNLLFYFKAPDDATPTGFILLEHCQISTAPVPAGMESQQEIPPCHFRIAFLSEQSRRTYDLVAPSSVDRAAWVSHLAAANVEAIAAEIKSLRARIAQLDPATSAGGGEDGSAATAAAVPRDAAVTDVSVPAAPHSRVSALGSDPLTPMSTKSSASSLMYTPSAGTAHALALTLRITASLPISLPLSLPNSAMMGGGSIVPPGPANGPHSTIVSKDCFMYLMVHQASGSRSTEWVPVRAFTSMTFFTLIPTHLTHETLVDVNLVLPDFTEVKLMDAVLDLKVFTRPSGGAPGQIKLTFRTEGAGAMALTIGTLLYSAVRLPSPLPTGHSLNAALPVHDAQYYQLNDASTIIAESLSESPWPIHVPQALLRLWIADEERIVAKFTDLVPSAPDIHVLRLRQLDVHKQLLAHYSDELFAIQDLVRQLEQDASASGHQTATGIEGSVSKLRPSVEKTVHAWQMVTLNCVVQRIRVMTGSTPINLGGSSSANVSPSLSRRTSTASFTGMAVAAAEQATRDCSYSVVTFGVPTAHALGFGGAGGSAMPSAPTSPTLLADSLSGSNGEAAAASSTNILSASLGPIKAASLAAAQYDATPPPPVDPVIASQALTVSAQRRAEIARLRGEYNAAAKTLQATLLETLPADYATIVTRAGHAAKEIAALVIDVASSLRGMDDDLLGGYPAHITELGCQLVEETVPLVAVRSQQVALLRDQDAWKAFTDTVARCTNQVELAADSVLALLDHHALLLDARLASPAGWQATRRRADWVFSQLLGAVVTGLEETVRGWFTDLPATIAGLGKPNALPGAAWGQWMATGWLCQFESLLSWQGDELGMLNDFRSALADLEVTVRVGVHAVDRQLRDLASWPADERVRITGDRRATIVSLGLPRDAWDALPRRTGLARIVPVLFTQGINEQQSLAGVFGGGKAQDMVNRRAYDRLVGFAAGIREYVGTQLIAQGHVSATASRAYFTYLDMIVQHFDSILAGSEIKLSGVMSTVVDESALSGGSALSAGTTGALGGLRRFVGAVTGGAKAKNTDILVMAAHITRVIGSLHLVLRASADGNGAGASTDPSLLDVHDRVPPFGSRPSTTTRFTSCKSAKDRTAMAVTLEQCFILQASHLMSPGDFESMLTAMRACGTRLRNVERNTGRPLYAFNALQWNMLPRLYRPPRYTIGGNQA